MLARCPSCRSTFSTERPGHQLCPVCGKPLVVPEPAPPPSSGLPPPSAHTGTPWERRAELGALRAWAETVRQALLEPGPLFRAADLGRASAQLGFAVLTTSVSLAVGQLLGLLVHAQTQAVLDRMLSQGDVPDWLRQYGAIARRVNTAGGTVLTLLLLPATTLVFVYLNAAVTHLFALMLRQSRRGFAATFAACAYGSSPVVLMAIPGCGFPIAVVWIVVLTGIGLKEVHGIKPAGAAATVIAPYFLACCFGCIAGLGLAAAMRSALR